MVNTFIEDLFKRIWDTVTWVYYNDEFQLENYLSNNNKYRIDLKEKALLYKKFSCTIKDNLLQFINVSAYIKILPNEINNLIEEFVFGEKYYKTLLHYWSDIPSSMWDFRVIKYPISQTRTYFLYCINLEKTINIPRTNLLRINKILCEIGNCKTYTNGYKLWKKINQKKRSWMKKEWLEDKGLSFAKI